MRFPRSIPAAGFRPRRWVTWCWTSFSRSPWPPHETPPRPGSFAHAWRRYVKIATKLTRPEIVLFSTCLTIMTRGEEMRHIEPTGPSTRDIIFNFLGDYVNPSNGVLWTSHLLMVLKVLGVGERASRSTLSRMKQRGWLVALRPR